MFPKVKKARLHRFHDSLAVSFTAVDSAGRPVKAETFYLPAALVEALSHSLEEFLSDFARRGFTGSAFPTRTVDESGFTERPTS